MDESVSQAAPEVAKNTDKPEPVSKADFDLRTEYVRLSWRLFRQIGPFKFAAQAQNLTQAMSLALMLGKDEESFVKLVNEVAAEVGLTPKGGV